MTAINTSAVQTVSGNTVGVHEEYGVLVYDVPQNNLKIYTRIQSRIRRHALRINLSVYLFKWGLKEKLEEIVEEARRETGQYAAVAIMKFDSSSEEELRRVAREALHHEIRDISRRLREKILAAEEEGERFIPDYTVSRTKKRLEEANGLAIMFNLSEDVKLALEAVEALFVAECDKIRAEFPNKLKERKKK